MEDLKQIQEFFSKPLEEGKQLDIVDFAKVVQAVTKTGHPVTVLLTPKFNEIEIITGMNAPDDMLFDLSNAVDSLGYDIIIAADSSNLSRREYSDIRRVNGGHKDYFEESVNEQADHVSPMVVKAYKEYLEAKKEGDGEKAYRYYSKKLNNTYSTRTDRDAIEAILKKKYGSALEESVNEVEEDPIDTITMDVPLFIRVLEYAREDAQADIDLHDLAEKAIAATKQQGLLQMDDYDMLVGDLEQIAMEEEEGYSKFLKDDPEHPGGKTKGLTPDVMNKILMNVIKDLDETKKLGKNLNEELCPKGKAYIKKRMAAGEKSSAYLSGRAVKVCKGQMKG